MRIVGIRMVSAGGIWACNFDVEEEHECMNGDQEGRTVASTTA
jgi:hypothetical protein